jgi:hypothetical protein
MRLPRLATSIRVNHPIILSFRSAAPFFERERRFIFIYGLIPLAIFHPQAQKALLIGLGGGHLSAMLARRDVHADVIEIDPAVASAARSFYVAKGQMRFLDAPADHFCEPHKR